jgi:HEPN domain-containing protein
MPHDPAKIALCREWLTIATSDLRAASILTKASPPAIHQALYFCQQCPEKTLKAFLVWHDVLPMKIHDLKILGEECARLDSSLGNLIPQVASLTAYGSMYRYPGGSEIEVSSEDADDAYRCASDTMRVVLARLPPEVFP